MKKPSYKWREVIKQMAPGVDYLYEELARMITKTHPDGQYPDASQVRAIVYACGHYLEMDKKTGNYRLTDKGINFTSD